MISENEIVLRLLIAAGLGAVIGLERELRGQSAGLRTYIILVTGASLAMTISINLAMQFRPLVPNGDPARLAAQVVSGIGFLGAGAILRFGSHVKGLTTATSLWSMAMVGLATGAGHTYAAVAATGILLVALVVLDLVEGRFILSYEDTPIRIHAQDHEGTLAGLRNTVASNHGRITHLSVQKDLASGEVQVDALARFREKQDLQPLMTELCSLEGVKTIKIG